MDEKPRVFARKPTKDELALGYAWGKDAEGELHVLKGIAQADRASHFYIVGATRMGKTKLLEEIIEQDIWNGQGFGVIDPHGDLIEAVKERLTLDAGRDLDERVVLIDPTNAERSVCFNPLEPTEGVSAAELAAEFVLVFKKIWADAWGARMEDILRNALIALIEKEQTLAELPLIFSDRAVRAKLTQDIKNEGCREFFAKFEEEWNKRNKSEWPESTLNKVSALLSDERVRRIFVSPKSSFNLREAIDGGKILLIKLDKGRLKGASDLLGSLLLSKIQMAAFSRTDTKPSERRQFYLYIDEFQNFATESFVDMLAEAGKYKLSLTLVHQNLTQLDKDLRASLLANCGLQAYFRLNRQDAELLAKEAFAGVWDDTGWEDKFQILQTLPPRVCLVKNKLTSGIVFIHLPNILPAHEEAGMDDDAFETLLEEARIGERYLRDSEDIEREYRARRESLAAGNEPERFRHGQRAGAGYKEMIMGGENNHVEFKESLRWNYEASAKDKLIEHAIAKAISAFINSDGGTLFIGVRDDGEILGIEKDLETLKGNKDAFLVQLTNIMNSYLGKEFNQYTEANIVPIGGKEVCVIEVAAGAMPVFLKNANVGREEFYVRASASSQSMSVRETNEYIKTHFSGRI